MFSESQPIKIQINQNFTDHFSKHIWLVNMVLLAPVVKYHLNESFPPAESNVC